MRDLVRRWLPGGTAGTGLARTPSAVALEGEPAAPVRRWGVPARLLRIVVPAAVLLKLVVAASGAVSPMPALLQLADQLASLVLVAGGIYLLVRGIGVLQRHLLWRIRRKLILSYVFIGVVPAC